MPLILELFNQYSNVMFSRDTSNVTELVNVFLHKPITLNFATRKDLLTFNSVGRERLALSADNFLEPANTKKVKCSKLNTFTQKASTLRQTRNKEINLSIILSNAFKIIQSGSDVVQTSQLLLALSDINGNLRPCQKSDFRNVLKSNANLSNMFLNVCDFNNPGPVALYVDFLYFLVFTHASTH